MKKRARSAYFHELQRTTYGSQAKFWPLLAYIICVLFMSTYVGGDLLVKQDVFIYMIIHKIRFCNSTFLITYTSFFLTSWMVGFLNIVIYFLHGYGTNCNNLNTFYKSQ